jgi:type II secretory pathway component PulJ
MTMIELVAALALFVVILGALLTIMNTATSLWSSSRSQQREQSVGQSVLEILTDDLQHAVTDSGTPTNTTGTVPPTFILDSRTNQPASDVQIVLQFARHAKRRASTGTTAGTPLSLDAVFYTFVNNALFRHVIPLSYETTFADAKPLGELLDGQRSKVEAPTLHAEILKYLKDPTKTTPAGCDWSFTLLAERIDLLNLPATLPEAYARKPPYSHPIRLAYQSATGLLMPAEYDYLETDVLPDHIDVAIRLHSEEDWAALARLQNDSSEEACNQMQHLGLLFSKRIAFPAQGGSRLP